MDYFRAVAQIPLIRRSTMLHRGRDRGQGQTVGIELNNCGIIIKTRNGQSAMDNWRLCACNVQRAATGCTSSFKGFVCGSSNLKHAIYREGVRGGETYVQGVSMR